MDSIFVFVFGSVATTIDMATTIEIIISVVVENAFKNKQQSKPLLKLNPLLKNQLNSGLECIFEINCHYKNIVKYVIY